MKIYRFRATSICQARASAQAGGMVNPPMAILYLVILYYFGFNKWAMCIALMQRLGTCFRKKNDLTKLS
jgi:hypothetical protein